MKLLFGLALGAFTATLVVLVSYQRQGAPLVDPYAAAPDFV